MMRSALERAGKELLVLQFPYCLHLDYRNECVDVMKFMAKHEGHDVQVVDEYGKLYSWCGDYSTGCECGKTHGCRLPKGHEGQHDWREPK